MSVGRLSNLAIISIQHAQQLLKHQNFLLGNDVSASQISNFSISGQFEL